MTESSSQYAATLSRMRKKWLLWSLLPVVLVLAVILFIAYTLMWNGLGTKAFESQSYPSASERFTKNTRWLPAEQWISQYNAGTATVAAGDYLAAIELFESAKTKAPKIDPEADYSQLDQESLPPLCLINANMSVAYALIGSEAADSGQPFLEEFREVLAEMAAAESIPNYQDLRQRLDSIAAQGIPLFQEAVDAYDKAQQVRAALGCPDPSNVSEALTAARQAAQDAIDEMQNPDLPPPPEEEPDPPEPEDNPDEGQDPPEGEDPPGGADEPDDPTGGEDELPANPDNDEGQGGGSNLSPGESDRREELNERNKAGQQERDSTESYMGGYEYAPKNW